MVNLKKSADIRHKIRDFMLSAAFYLSVASLSGKAQAQTPAAPESKLPQDKPKTSLNCNMDIGIENLSVLRVDKNSIAFYNDLMPSISASVENSKGYRAEISAGELFVYDDKKLTPTLNMLMLEFYKKIKNDGELILRVGRDNTQGNDDIPVAIDYMADTRDDEAFSNDFPRMVLGYQKEGHFFELGIIQCEDYGEYTFIPNPQKADFFGKAHLALLAKDDKELSVEFASYLGKHSRAGFTNVNFSKGGFGAKALFQYDFKNDEAKYLLRAYQKLHRGFTIIEEIAHRGNDCGVDFRLCGGKKGLQVFTQYSTEDKTLQLGASYFFSLHKKINQK